MELRRSSRRSVRILENSINTNVEENSMIRGAILGLTTAIAIIILTMQYIPDDFGFIYGLVVGIGTIQLSILIEEALTGR